MRTQIETVPRLTVSNLLGAVLMKVNPKNGAQLRQMANASCVGVGAISQAIEAAGTNLEEIQHYVLTERAGRSHMKRRTWRSAELADFLLGVLLILKHQHV